MKFGKYRLICFLLHFWKYDFVKVESYDDGSHIATYFCPKCKLHRDLRA